MKTQPSDQLNPGQPTNIASRIQQHSPESEGPSNHPDDCNLPESNYFKWQVTLIRQRRGKHV